MTERKPYKNDMVSKVYKKGWDHRKGIAEHKESKIMQMKRTEIKRKCGKNVIYAVKCPGSCSSMLLVINIEVLPKYYTLCYSDGWGIKVWRTCRWSMTISWNKIEEQDGEDEIVPRSSYSNDSFSCSNICIYTHIFRNYDDQTKL